MKKYFLDTNIILDFLQNRQPFSQYALKIFEKSINDWELWTTDNCITTSYYILEKQVGYSNARRKIGLLLKYLKIQSISKQELIGALDLPFKDYEDAVQYMAAVSNGKIDAIITRNKKDFKHSQITVLSPDELFI